MSTLTASNHYKAHLLVGLIIVITHLGELFYKSMILNILFDFE